MKRAEASEAYVDAMRRGLIKGKLRLIMSREWVDSLDEYNSAVRAYSDVKFLAFSCYMTGDKGEYLSLHDEYRRAIRAYGAAVRASAKRPDLVAPGPKT